MEQTVCSLLRRALCSGMNDILCVPVADADLRLPARDAAVSSPRAIALDADAARWADMLTQERSRFPAVCGAPPVSAVRAENGWLLFDLHPAFYSAAVRQTLSASDAPPACDAYACHRMRMLARYPGLDCPDVPQVQRALLLCLAAADRPAPALRAQAEQALLSMAYALPPAERQALLRTCGGVAGAALRLLYA